jgi:hypothetical protein
LLSSACSAAATRMAPRSIKQKLQLPLYLDLIGQNARLSTWHQAELQSIGQKKALRRQLLQLQEEYDVSMDEHQASLARTQTEQVTNSANASHTAYGELGP